MGGSKKKTYSCLARRVTQKDYNHISSFAHVACRHRNSLSNCVRKIKKNQRRDPILKWEILKIKESCEYKAGDKYCDLCMGEKLAIAYYDNPNKLLYQKSEILNV